MTSASSRINATLASMAFALQSSNISAQSPPCRIKPTAVGAVVVVVGEEEEEDESREGDDDSAVISEDNCDVSAADTRGGRRLRS
jgi:hypothetical protein